MATQQRSSVVGVFPDQASAQKAVSDLRRAGFSDDQIGVAARDVSHDEAGGTSDSYATQGAATGAAAGAGIGALWGLGILAGVLPVIGPAIAGGALAALISSAAAGAAAAGLAGALVGMGIPKHEAEYYESEMHAGRVIVTVRADGREDEARAILRTYNAYDFANRGTTTPSPRAAVDTAYANSVPKNNNTGTVKAVDEELRVNKTAAQKAGEVSVRKEVRTETKTIEVPVVREEVVIERRTPTGTAATDLGNHEQQIRIPIMEEQVSVTKVPVVKEEVSVSKRKVTTTEQFTESLRKEDIKVETDGNANVRDNRHKKS